MKYVRHKGLGVRRQGKSLRPSHLTPHALRLTSSRRSQLILVIGGPSSGKSAAAFDLAGKSAKRACVATGEPLEEEMADKILRYRASRGWSWQPHQVLSDLGERMKAHGEG